jgi:hypothetical protein
VTAEALAATLRRSPVIPLDFDGPVCSVFAGHPASQITDELRGPALDQVGKLPPAVPRSPARTVAECGCRRIACRDAGRQLAIVSNNPGASVRPTIESAWPVSSGTSKLATHPIQLS